MPYGSGYVAAYTGPQINPSPRLPTVRTGAVVKPELKQLTWIDALWLAQLSRGALTKQLWSAASEQMAKNRMAMIRRFLKSRTTAQAVAEAIRRGIIK